MKGMDFMTSRWTFSARRITSIVMGLFLTSCVINAPAVSEAEYSRKIVGTWEGAVGDVKETMTLNGDDTFVCQVQPMGFIANTLSQSVASTVRGTWKITGVVITLRITDAGNENLENTTASSTIVAFKENILVLKSDHGETSSFQRVRAL